ncbi:MAG: IS21 family transposase [Caulobacterales bacterium]
MRRAREILGMKFEAGLAVREIARRTDVPRRTVRTLFARFAARGLTWPIAPEVSEADLEALMFKEAGAKSGSRRRAEPDWSAVHKELKRKHVTLQILWDEYIERHPDGYRYSRFCEVLRAWEDKLSVTMRQNYLGGEKLFVDYAGDTVPVIIDRQTGETRAAHIFVAVIGASSLTYAEATWTEGLSDWIGAHTRTFAFIGGAPKLVIPDNPKVAVIKACFYEPMVNRTYEDMLKHYDTTALPARPRKPRDKSKVEAAVRIMERYLLGRLRNRLFYSLAELNTAIRKILTHLNDEFKIRRLGVTRRALFEEIDKPNLTPLPVEGYVYAEWRIRRANLDYHVDVDGSFYSVPFQLAREKIEARITARTIELFVKGQRVAAHARLATCGRHTTVPEHMPSSHRRHGGWSAERIQTEAQSIGPNAALYCTLVLAHKHHPEQGYRACLGIVRLPKTYGRDRVEAACERALEIGARTYASVKSILEHRLDQRPTNKAAADEAPIQHPNIRGRRYYE